jgi:predicted ribosome quality control (RQC) complex YloA/Tae2 family protein
VSLNWKEIDLILSELSLEGSHVQKVRQPDYKRLLLELYRPGSALNLLISLEQGRTRLHSTERKVENRIPLQRFAQFLRSRIQGGRITEVYQIEQDRIVLFRITKAGQTTKLYVRLWGGAANVIATDPEHTILDAFFRRPARGEVSGEHYDPLEQIRSTRSSGARQNTFTVREYPGEETSFNRYIEEEYRRRELEAEKKRLREKTESRITKRRRKIRDTLAALEEKEQEAERAERYKELGDMILGNLHRINTGDHWAQVENFYSDNEPIDIELDPELSPQKNAEGYYERYRKAKRNDERLREEAANRRRELQHLEEWERAFDEASGLEEEVTLLNRFLGQEEQRGGKEKKEGDIPGLRFHSGQFLILVGRTARENDELLRRYANGNDYWLHTRDVPGGYVFIKHISGKSVPLETLLDAGNLAVYYSKARNAGKAELYYTRVKHLRRAKDGKKGLVLPTQEKNLAVEIDEQRLRRLFQGNGSSASAGAAPAGGGRTASGD